MLRFGGWKLRGVGVAEQRKLQLHSLEELMTQSPYPSCASRWQVLGANKAWPANRRPADSSVYSRWTSLLWYPPRHPQPTGPAFPASLVSYMEEAVSSPLKTTSEEGALPGQREWLWRRTVWMLRGGLSSFPLSAPGT